MFLSTLYPFEQMEMEKNVTSDKRFSRLFYY